MKITFSTVIRIMALVLAILFFVPNFVISCDYTGENVAEISPFNIAAGNITVTSSNLDEDTSSTTEQIDAIPAYFILLAVLIIIAVLGKKLPAIGMFLTILYIGLLVIMSEEITDFIDSEYQGYLSFEATPAGIINYYLALSLFIVLFICLIVGISNRYKEKKNKTVSPAVESSANIPQANITQCHNCGYETDMNKAYCRNCGAKLEVNHSLPENKKSDGAAYCNNCGHKIDENMTFCGNCGVKLKQTESFEENGK